MKDTYRGLCSPICRQVLEQQWRVCCKRPGTRQALCQQQQEGPAWSCGRRLMPITSATLLGCSASGRQADSRMLQSCSPFPRGMVLLDPGDSLPEDRHGSLHTHASCSVRSPIMQNFRGMQLQASKAPSKDLSAREIAAAERFSEHLLFLQRHQRAFLFGLGVAHARLLALANLLSAFADAESIPEQVPHCHPFSFDHQQTHTACCSKNFKNMQQSDLVMNFLYCSCWRL